MKNLAIFLLFSVYALIATAQANDPLFIFDQFHNAKIHFKNRSVTVAQMNYDAVNDRMYFKQNGELMELSNQEMIDSIAWAGKRCFITYGKNYLEKVKLDNGTCYIAWRIRNVNVGSAGALGSVTQGKVETINVRSMGVFSAEDPKSHNADVFQQKNSNEYYLSIGGKFKKVANKKQLLKLFPKHKAAIEEYMDKEKIQMTESLSALQLLNFCLGLK